MSTSYEGSDLSSLIPKRVSLGLKRAFCFMLIGPVIWIVFDVNALSHPQTITVALGVAIALLRWRAEAGGLRSIGSRLYWQYRQFLILGLNNLDFAFTVVVLKSLWELIKLLLPFIGYSVLFVGVIAWDRG